MPFGSTTNTWTICIFFKYRFCGKNVVKSGKLFAIVQEAVHFNHKKSGQNAQRRKKETLEVKTQKKFVELLSKGWVDAD